MSEFTSTKPYMIMAIHEWCVDNQLTPHLLVEVNAQTRVPMAYVKDGEIVLNLNHSATKDLYFTNEAISFSARFSGASNNLYIPISAVKGIFARENGQGMFFEVHPEDLNENKNNDIEFSDKKEKNISSEVKKTTLKLVK
ncbi:ClpXP protease specificity-enhancing factor [Candidatus Methylopumilus turicensis]|uniref:Stringent starvation protein B homolog n=1 Tax=Candidatus Methylopumilus turicensis TaxID=1581680 RepID=A0A0B7ISN8_9PROT|nr:ClpXP protease specificity-enhancing factor [Candidatus Methylopumilus turicensis]CEN55273.1 Stringent starvation protein B homolog [Candidatus Methylopumilus turicensis]